MAEWARERFERSPVARLATVDPGGAPHLVPVVFAIESDSLWTAVDGKPKASRSLRRLANLRANPRVSLLVDHYEDDWSALWWVRVDGLATVLEPGSDEEGVGIARLAAKYAQYQADPPAGPVVLVKVETWRSWSAHDPDTDGVGSLFTPRDRDAGGRARQARPRDALGRPLPYGSQGVEPVSEEPLPPDETLEAARTLVASGRPFSAHEVLEARWKAGPVAERDLWQGLAQVCVALTHAARGNRRGAERLVERAGEHLAAYAATSGATYGLDLDAITACARDRIGEGAPPHS